MLSRLRPRSIYDVMAAVGCFAALATGTAYAANTIGSTDIIDGQVKSADVGDGEIGSADIKDNSVNTFDVHSFLGVDVVDNSLTGADIDESTLSLPRLSNVVVRSSAQVTLPANDSVTVTAPCNQGEVALGGGFRGDSQPQYFNSLRHSLPEPDTVGGAPTGWTVVVRGGTSSHVTTAYVVCAKVG